MTQVTGAQKFRGGRTQRRRRRPTKIGVDKASSPRYWPATSSTGECYLIFTGSCREQTP